MRITWLLVGFASLAIAAPVHADVPPTNTAPPVVNGPQPPHPGDVLTETPGVWTGPAEVTTQWVDCDAAVCRPIAGTTGGTYTVRASDVGHGIAVVETSHRDGYALYTVYSAPTAVVQPAPAVGIPPASRKFPAISGWLVVGQTLSVTTGTWSGTQPVTLSYQWLRCLGPCVEIPGATGPTLKLTDLENGDVVDCRVTAANALGSQTVQSTHFSTPVGPPGGGRVPVAATEAALRRAAMPKGHAGAAAQLLRHNGYTTSFVWKVAGTLNIQWKAGTVKIASVQLSQLFRNLKVKPKIKLTPAGRRLLKHDPHPVVSIAAAFVPQGTSYPVLIDETKTL